MSSDMESRYGHLLQPIRDLAQNWHIDIAQELEEYLHELDSLTISIDTSQPSLLSASTASSSASSLQSLNFAEAALLIQGSACVYSKKVEYLYSLLYQTLDAIIDNRRKQAKKTSSISQEGQDADVDDDREAELLPLDDLQEACNIDLDERNTAPYAQLRKNTLLQRPPAALLHNSGPKDSEQKEAISFRVCQPAVLTTERTTRTQLTELISLSAGPSAAFVQISDCTVHPSGALLLESRDGGLVDSSLRLVSAAPFGSPAAVLQARRDSQQAEPVSQELDFDDGDEPEAAPQLRDEVLTLPSIPSQPVPAAAAAAPASPSSPAADFLSPKTGKAVRFASDGHLCDYRDAARFSLPPDPYALLDAFDASLPTRPFRKGNNVRKYRQQGAVAAGGEQLFFSASGVFAAVSAEIARGSVRVPCHAEFGDLFMREMQRRKKQERSRRKRQREEAAVAARHDSGAAQQLAVPQPPAVDDGRDDDCDAFDVLQPADDDADADEWNQPSLPSSSLSSSSALDGELQSLGRTYEELCREHLDAYLHSADEYLHSTAMTQRVKEWQEKLEPILEEEDAHPEFDIRQYGDRMIVKVGEEEQLQHTDVVEFESVVRGAARYEVCRLFLAALQLANNRNVDIIPPSAFASSQRGIDGSSLSVLGLRLLSCHQRRPGEVMEEEMRLGQQQQRAPPERAKADVSKTVSDDDGEERRERRRKRGKAERATDKREKAQALQSVDINAGIAESVEEEMSVSKQRQRRRRVLRD